MSRKLMLAMVAGLLLLTMLGGAALAQGTQPPAPDDMPQFDQRFPLPWGGMGRGGLFGNPGLGMPRIFEGEGLFGMDGDGWKVYDAVAAALKLTPTQLFEQLHSGKTLEEIANAQGVKMADVLAAAQTAARDAMKARIEQAVTEGRLTRQQADQLLKRLEQGTLNPGINPRGGFFRNWRGLPFFGGPLAPEFSF